MWQLEKSFYKSEKKSGEHPEKNLGRCYPKSQVVPYKNLGRFYRVSFKSLLKVRIKWAYLSDKQKCNYLASFVESNRKGTYGRYAYWVNTFDLGKCISQTQINLAQFDRQVISYLSYNSEITDSIYCSAVGWWNSFYRLFFCNKTSLKLIAVI